MSDVGGWWSKITAAAAATCEDRVDALLETGVVGATSQDLALAILLGDEARRSQLIYRIEQVKDKSDLRLIQEGLKLLPSEMSSQWKQQISDVRHRLDELERQGNEESINRIRELAKSRRVTLRPKKSQ